jgi:Phospholipase_D-nuclease N-terminal/Short C-terminal domain
MCTSVQIRDGEQRIGGYSPEGGCKMPLLDVFFTMMWFFLWVLWFFLLFRVIMDIFRSRDLGGWGKAGWLVFVIVLPFLGVFVYLIARGHKMADRDAAQAQAQDKAFRAYVQETAQGTPSTADELAKLADLHDHGVITDADFEAGKAQALHRPAA